MENIGETGRILGIEDCSRKSFCNLVEYVIETIIPTKVLYAGYSSNITTKFPPIQNGHLFDIPLTGCKQILYNSGGNVVKADMFPGEVFYTPPLCWKYPVWGTPHEMCAFIFNQHYIRLTYINIPEPMDDEYLPTIKYFYHTNDSPGKEINGILHSLQALEDAGDPRDASPELIKGLFKLLWATLEHGDQEIISKRKLTYQRALQYLQDNYHAPINREHVAKVMNLHPSYLSRLFKKYNSDSFYAVLTSIRMEHAAFLLENTDILIDEIADRCGFLATGIFYSSFKKYYGKPPGMFRREAFLRKK